MLRLSARRALSAAPLANLNLNLKTSAPAVVQLRFSSSKPSRSDNDSSNGNGNGIAAGQSQSVSATAGGRAGGKAASGKGKRKNGNKDAYERGAAFDNLPSVPETHHISQEALSLSSFFSLHRPISITQTMPRTVTDEHFASIFARRSKSSKIADAMSTISNTIDQLDGPMASAVSVSTRSDHAHADQDGGMHKIDVRNADGSESSIYMQVDAMSGDFFPFRPPPLPQPGNGNGNGNGNAAADPEAAAADHHEHDHDAATASSSSSRHRVYKAVFTIEETVEADGRVHVLAHSPGVIDQEMLVQHPRSFLERLALRQTRFDEVRNRRVLYAISVKRQRKLRMKKKKYKKLMKKTRNLRRKLDRT